MALIPDEPKKRNAVLAIVAGILVLGGVYQYVYTPKTEELGGMRDRLEALETRNRQAQLTATRGGANLEEQLALYERHVIQLEQLIPAAEEVPALLSNVQSEAIRTGVEVASFVPEPVQAGTFYRRQSYSMRAWGEYHDMGRFLTSIASLSRIITPVQVEISRFNDPTGIASDMESPVVASFRIETYVLPSEGTGPPGAEMGGTGGPGGDR